MVISFISWVNNMAQYSKFQKSAHIACQWNCEFIPIYEAKSMAEAYNIGTKQATWDIIVYVHQDIIIRDTKFQEILEWIFVSWNNIWFAWPVGNTILTSKAWWNTVSSHQWAWQILQWEKKFESFENQNCIAWNLDWCMLCTDKKFIFPEQLPLIHFIDAWMCREAINKGYNNHCFQSYIQHLSQWTIDNSYYNNMYIYQKHFNLI